MKNKGKLYLIPTVIAEGAMATIPSSVTEALKQIHHFLAEDVRTARRYLSGLKIYEKIEDLHFSVLNKDTTYSDLEDLFAPIFQEKNLGVLSESGCPGIADPGALAAQYAHEKNIEVIPLVGPSSVLLALMASGLSGQQFAFQGYLPIDAKDATHKIKQLEKESREKNQTQIFIETPYRNNKVLKNLTQNLLPKTRLCIAFNLTGESEFIKTKLVSEWKNSIPTLSKEPAVFLFQAEPN